MDKLFFENNLARIHDWVKAADQKVAIWIAFQAILVALVTPFFSNEVIPNIQKESWIIVGFLILSMTLFCFSFFKSISAITPRLASKNGKQSLIYFGHIAKMNFEEYKKRMDTYFDKEYLEDLQQQVYISSKIAYRKHSEFRTSVLTFFASVVSFLPVIFALNV